MAKAARMRGRGLVKGNQYKSFMVPTGSESAPIFPAAEKEERIDLSDSGSEDEPEPEEEGPSGPPSFAPVQQPGGLKPKLVGQGGGGLGTEDQQGESEDFVLACTADDHEALRFRTRLGHDPAVLRQIYHEHREESKSRCCTFGCCCPAASFLVRLLLQCTRLGLLQGNDCCSCCFRISARHRYTELDLRGSLPTSRSPRSPFVPKAAVASKARKNRRRLVNSGSLRSLLTFVAWRTESPEMRLGFLQANVPPPDHEEMLGEAGKMFHKKGEEEEEEEAEQSEAEVRESPTDTAEETKNGEVKAEVRSEDKGAEAQDQGGDTKEGTAEEKVEKGEQSTEGTEAQEAEEKVETTKTEHKEGDEEEGDEAEEEEDDEEGDEEEGKEAESDQPAQGSQVKADGEPEAGDLATATDDTANDKGKDTTEGGGGSALALDTTMSDDHTESSLESELEEKEQLPDGVIAFRDMLRPIKVLVLDDNPLGLRALRTLAPYLLTALNQDSAVMQAHSKHGGLQNLSLAHCDLSGVATRFLVRTIFLAAPPNARRPGGKKRQKTDGDSVSSMNSASSQESAYHFQHYFPALSNGGASALTSLNMSFNPNLDVRALASALGSADLVIMPGLVNLDLSFCEASEADLVALVQAATRIDRRRFAELNIQQAQKACHWARGQLRALSKALADWGYVPETKAKRIWGKLKALKGVLGTPEKPGRRMSLEGPQPDTPQDPSSTDSKPAGVAKANPDNPDAPKMILDTIGRRARVHEHWVFLDNYRTVHTVELSCLNLTDNDAVAMATSFGYNPALQILDLSNNRIGSLGARAILAQVKLKEGASIDFSGNRELLIGAADVVGKWLWGECLLGEIRFSQGFSIEVQRLKGTVTAKPLHFDDDEDVYDEFRDPEVLRDWIERVDLTAAVLTEIDKLALFHLIDYNSRVKELNGLSLSEDLTLFDFSLAPLEPYELVFLGRRLSLHNEVTSLNLSGCALMAETSGPIFDAMGKHLNLKHLSLDNNLLADDGAQRLGRALKNNRSLTDLRVAHNAIGDDGTAFIVAALAVSPQSGPALRRLDLSGNGVGQRSLSGLRSARLRGRGSLERLDARNCRLTDAMLQRLAEGLVKGASRVEGFEHVPTAEEELHGLLETLTAAGTTATGDKEQDDHLEAKADAPDETEEFGPPQLEFLLSLDLGGHSCYSLGLVAIAQAVTKLSKLQTLLLGRIVPATTCSVVHDVAMEIAMQQAAALAEAEESKDKDKEPGTEEDDEDLDLDDPAQEEEEEGPKKGKAAIKMPQRPPISTTTVARVEIDDTSVVVTPEAVYSLVDMMCAHPSLMHVDLSGLGLGDDGACQLADILEGNATLAVVRLQSNHITGWGGEFLMRALGNNLGLKVLDIGRNPIGQGQGPGHGAAAELAGSFLLNNSLEQLDLTDCSLRISGVKKLLPIFKERTHFDGFINLRIGNNGLPAPILDQLRKSAVPPLIIDIEDDDLGP